MRWSQPHHGKVRVVRKFALFPIRIYNERRWLESCYIKQEYNLWGNCWLNVEFLTKEEAESVVKKLRGKDTNVLAKESEDTE